MKTAQKSGVTRFKRILFSGLFPILFSGLFFLGLSGLFSFPAAAQAKKSASSPGPLRAVTIVTEPNTTVWIDDVRYGKTGEDGKLEIKTVSAGRHSLRLRADGFKEVAQSILPAQKGEIKVELVKTTDQAEMAFQEAEKMLTVDREKAAELYRKAIKLRPKYPEAYLALARVLSDSQKLDEALKAVQAARKQRLNYAEASAVEGRIYKELGEEEKALASFKRAITEGKGFQPEAYTGLGLFYKDKAEEAGGGGDFEQEEANYLQAVKYLRSGIKQLSGAPDAEVLYQFVGLIYEKMKRYDDAIEVYEEFLEIFPDSSETTAVRSFIVQIKKQKSGQ